MDAFAVSISDGMTFNKINIKKALAIALTFGLYQAAMPLLGFLGGSLFYEQIKHLDHWIALILLAFLGGKMIFESIQMFRDKKNEKEIEIRHTNMTFKLLMVQGIATSIDALAVGISLAAVNANIIYSASIIGAITAVVCLPAVFLGKKTGDILSDKAELLGGLILVGIGVKIFIQHVFFNQ